MHQDYVPRVVDSQIARMLSAVGGIIIEGPKACGKTRTGQHHAASAIRLDATPEAARTAQADPALALQGERPRLVDEWQLAPNVWNRARFEIDEAGLPGQFILTGSALPADDATRHSGAGRIARVRMRPFTLFESGLSTGAVSLAGLLAGEAAGDLGPGIGLGEIIDAICAGGWPGRTGDLDLDLDLIDAYLAELGRTDVLRAEPAARNPAMLRLVLAAWARGLGSQMTLASVQRDAGREGNAPALSTIVRYVDALERLMVIEDQPAWRTSLRSRARIRVAPKRQFTDPSIAVSVLGASPAMLRRDGATLGMLFEGLVVRDLRVYAGPLGGEVFHFRDNTGLEIDAIVQLRDGRWGAIEVKLGEAEADRAARHLLRFSDKLDTSRTGNPAFLAVVTAVGSAYRRDDGIWVIPISLLGP